MSENNLPDVTEMPRSIHQVSCSPQKSNGQCCAAYIDTKAERYRSDLAPGLHPQRCDNLAAYAVLRAIMMSDGSQMAPYTSESTCVPA